MSPSKFFRRSELVPAVVYQLFTAAICWARAKKVPLAWTRAVPLVLYAPLCWGTPNGRSDRRTLADLGAASIRRGRTPLVGTRIVARHSAIPGNMGREQYECTVARFRKLRLSSVPIRLEGLGFFDSAGIFFAGVRVTPELLLLQERVTAATGLCGFFPEGRAYRPHITLARSRGKQQGLRELKTKVPHQPNFTKFVAEEFFLYESFLGTLGARYESRERFPLDGR